MRYDPPPTWPQPPAGWQPPPGWTPDPEWGPVPPGWQLWVPDEAGDSSGGYAAPGPTPGYGAPGYGAAGYTAPGATPGGGGSGTVWAVVGIVVVLALIGGVVAVLLNRGSDEPATATASAAPSSTGSQATSTDGTVSAPVPTTCADVPGTRQDPAPVGQGTVVGDYCVAITKIVSDATAEVVAARPDNPQPTNGRYVLLTVSAINQGTEAKDAYLDLFVELRATDGSEYADTDCEASGLPQSLVSRNQVAPDDTVTGTLCLDVPSAPLDGATLTIRASGEDTGKVFAPR